MSNKITKREIFTDVMNFISESNFCTERVTREQAVEMLKHEIELLERKNTSNRKPTAQQTENSAIKEAIVNGMEDDRLYTVTEIMREIEACKNLTNQRCSALLNGMAKEGMHIEKVEEKRKSFFKVIR